MGQKLSSIFDYTKYNINAMSDFICPICQGHLLLELIQTKNEILIRLYCYCGTITTNINKDLKFFLQIKNSCQGTKCRQTFKLTGYDNPNLTKYCHECSSFFCDRCASKHYHKNIIDAKDFKLNCKYHKNSRLIGFCKKCKISICDKCINNKLHNKHVIKYLNDIKNLNEELKIFENNLNRAYIKMNELIKMKYGQEFNLKVTNALVPQKIILDAKDEEIIFCLELLKTFYHIYIIKEKNNILNYHTISHILKHKDFEIIQLKDIEKKVVPSSRIISIGSEDNNNLSNQSNNNIFGHIKNIFIKEEKKEEINKNINIFLKIDLKDKEIRKNEINIEFDKFLNKDIFLIGFIKLIKLRNGNLAVGCQKCIYIFKNLEETNIKIVGEINIIDFDELDNENICILTENELEVFERIDNGNYINKISIHLNSIQISYNYKIKKISNNNITFLSCIKNEKSFLTYLQYPDYTLKEIRLLDLDYEGDLIQIGNEIIICFAVLEAVKIFFYNIDTTLLESINFNSCQTYKKPIKCFKINDQRILLSAIHTGIIFNVITRQVETFIKQFKNLNFVRNIGNYPIAVVNNRISQIDYRIGKLFNNHDINIEKKIHDTCIILDIIDVGNNQFCVCIPNYLCLFNYNV